MTWIYDDDLDDGDTRIHGDHLDHDDDFEP